MFRKAEKTKAKLRLALYGPAGSGKTFTALRLANGIGGTVALIDTEHGSSELYADRFEFDVCNLEDKRISGYIKALRAAQQAGYEVVIIDSLTHAWEELKAFVDENAKNYRGNNWSAWSDANPKQRAFVEAILTYPGHVIATMRSRTEWTTETTSNGKVKPVRVGLQPEQGKGIEYEFGVLMQMDSNHGGTVVKDRTSQLQGKYIEEPGEEMGRWLSEWLSKGSEPKPAPKQGAPDEVAPIDDDTGPAPQVVEDEAPAPATPEHIGRLVAEMGRPAFIAAVKRLRDGAPVTAESLPTQAEVLKIEADLRANASEAA